MLRCALVFLNFIAASVCLQGLTLADQQTAAQWWSFRVPERPEIPQVADTTWPRNAIDHFVLSRLETEAIAPSGTADRTTLIRRASLDLVGLPPSPQEVDAFVADDSPEAYEHLVDRLLASQHFGERWARHWLDVARYADSMGGEIDLPRPVWQYRDWVIGAFNENLPFDDFIVWQVAGDMLPNATDEQKIATGFYRCGVYDRLAGNGSDEVARLESVVDRVNTTGAAFLGLTMACAQCHDHKFDPISTDEYYQMFAFFNDADDVHLGFPSKDRLIRQKTHRELIKVLKQELSEYETKSPGRANRWETNLTEEERQQLPDEVQAALRTGVEIRDEHASKVVLDAYFAQDAGHRTRGELIGQLEAESPEIELVPVMGRSSRQRTTHVYISGDFHSKGEIVSPEFPDVLNFEEESAQEKARNRLDLAKWLVDRRHPLTARVTVNRIWQRYFGQGLVATESDFGTRGALPSHPLLLDWLAQEFVESGWDLKALHRLIVSSATYRQSSRPRADLAQRDPQNSLLARQARIRLDAEIIRDASLAASGLLNPKVGGPTVHPYQPAGVLEGRATKVDWIESADADKYRRGMYTHQWRLTPHPFYRTFDAPEALASCTRRYRSNTPLQALTLLNSPSFVEAAQALARRVLKAQDEDAKRLEHAFRLALSRAPSETETQILAKLLNTRREEFRQHPDRAAAFVPAADPKSTEPVSTDIAERAAWTATCRAVMNLDEFITRE